MGTCNTTQNEIGGKQLLLKACQQKTAGTTNASDNIAITTHGLKVGDLVRPKTVGAVTTLVVNTLYFVKTVVDANTIEVSATRGGAAIVADATEAALTFDVFKSLGGIRSKSFSFSSEGIDITSQDSDEWKKMLDGAGIRALSVSGSGVYSSDEIVKDLRVNAFSNSLSCLMFIDIKQDIIFDGCFKITSLEIGGDYDGESNFSISAESSGEITVTDL